MDPGADRGPRLPPERAGKKRRQNRDSEFIDNSSAPTASVGSSGRRSGASGSGPSRENQQRATEAAVAVKAREREDGERGNGLKALIEDELSEESRHAEKVRKQQGAWKERLPGLRSLYLDSLGCNIDRVKGQQAAQQSALQAEIDNSYCSCPQCPQPQPLHSQQPDGNVWYYGLHGTFQLALHKSTCSCCNQTFSPQALSFGCFPSTPVTAHVWYDLRVLRLYKSFGPMEGLSHTG